MTKASTFWGGEPLRHGDLAIVPKFANGPIIGTIVWLKDNKRPPKPYFVWSVDDRVKDCTTVQEIKEGGYDKNPQHLTENVNNMLVRVDGRISKGRFANQQAG